MVQAIDADAGDRGPPFAVGVVVQQRERPVPVGRRFARLATFLANDACTARRQP
jgi:hypothetical protein